MKIKDWMPLTQIEFLVVASIIAVLIALLLPAVFQAKRAGEAAAKNQYEAGDYVRVIANDAKGVVREKRGVRVIVAYPDNQGRVNESDFTLPEVKPWRDF